MSAGFYQVVSIAIAIFMVCLAVITAKKAVRVCSSWLVKPSLVVRAGALIALMLAVLVTLYFLYAFLVTVFLLFSGAAAPGAQKLPDAYFVAMLLWIPVVPIALLWSARALWKRVQ